MRRRRHHRPHIRTRDALAIAKPRLRSSPSIIEKILRPKPAPLATWLRSLEDRREFHPEYEQRPARAFTRSASRLVVPDKAPDRPGKPFVPSAVGFSNPSSVAICIRRHARREVLAAKGKLGANRPGRWSEYSWIDCRPDGRSGHRSKRR